jgi:hypothetical protein
MTISIPLLRREEPHAEPAAETPLQAPVDPEPQPAAPPAAAGQGRPGVLAECSMMIADAIRATRRNLRRLASRDGNWVAEALGFKPRSINEQRDYLANRRWLSPGHEGGIQDRLGEAYQVAYGVPGVAFGNAVGWTFKHGFRFAVVTAGFLVLLFAGCKFVLGLPAATSLLVPGLLAVMLTGYLVLVLGLLASRRAFAQWRAER